MIDQFYLEKMRLFHCRDIYSRLSAMNFVPDGSFVPVSEAIERTWIAQFWPPVAAQGDQEF